MKKLCLFLSLFVALPATSSFAQSKRSKEVQKKDVVKKPQKSSFDINKANAQTLAKMLQGIDAKQAQAIVAYRSARGAFRTTDDLLRVPGMAKAVVARNLRVLGLARGRISLETTKPVKKAKEASTKKKKVGGVVPPKTKKSAEKTQKESGAKPLPRQKTNEKKTNEKKKQTTEKK